MLKRIFLYLLLNGIVDTCFYFGITHGNGLSSLAGFWTWFMFFLSTMMTLAICTDVKGTSDVFKSYAKKPNLPTFLLLTHDIALAVFLAWNNWTVTAAIVLLDVFSGQVRHAKAKETLEKIKTTPATNSTPQ